MLSQGQGSGLTGGWNPVIFKHVFVSIKSTDAFRVFRRLFRRHVGVSTCRANSKLNTKAKKDKTRERDKEPQMLSLPVKRGLWQTWHTFEKITESNE